MDAFSKLPDELNALVESFKSHAAWGNLQVGVTQYSFYMYIACILLLVLVFRFCAKQKGQLVPKGRFVNAMEYGVEFVRDSILSDSLGDTWRKHFPFLATVFFFVLINNMLGLIPGMHPGTGCIGTTAAVALMSFVYFIVVGCRKRGVWGYIKSLAPKGVAFPINILVWLIEVFSTFLRLITLAVRLFCNMYAGHIVMGTFAILASLFFEPLLQQVTAQALAGSLASVAWIAVLIIIYLVEMLVAFIQAYVFTLLSTVYVQLAEQDD
ncbi:MAG: F0F1 ATP synthase subunit A [Atopobiaceae bacterium]|nr:F0F1 ATP synthase subunit A [Atopobiaceae bacterium]MCH4119818.1 F0F1 ATP synthase subunit A [Atopobiaceae bacterium]MCI1318196.1 F0F1 ATP synthase subunit A [Atopobiaceae bacterium]MCI1389099.1 F0F1 ATP synthase subunit A [Atopobiaceae bacterium]MCI1432890.1 F0F1 ATP synthase subunit A [Atopobiaceae bacterium]